MKTILTILFISSGVLLHGQEVFHIIHVKGTITVKSSGKILKRGDKVSAAEQIVFASKDDMAAVLSSKKGRYIIQPRSKINSESELSSFIKDVVFEASGKLSTRGMLSNLLDLRNHFSGDYLVLGGRSAVFLSSGAFPMDDKTFFYIRYDYLEESINKKLPNNGDTLILSEKDLFTVDKIRIDKTKARNFQLYYYHNEFKKSQLVGGFNPVFPDDEYLLPEVQMIVDAYKGSNKAPQLRDEIEAYLSQVYGHVHKPNYNRWVKRNFGL